MPTPIVIRQLAQPDATAFRDLRLAGLEEAPTAFGSSYAAEKDRTVEDFATTIASNYLAGAFAGKLLVGVAGFYRLSGEKVAHRGHVWGVYVAPAWRRRGIAALVLEHLLAYAGQHVLQVNLTVAVDNDSALAVYTRLGFVTYGTEPMALRIGNQFYDQHLMVWTAPLKPR